MRARHALRVEPGQPVEAGQVVAVLVSGAMTGRPSALPSWKSSAPPPGAMWTMPVPSSSPTSSHGDDAVLVRRLAERRLGPRAARRTGRGSASRPAPTPGCSSRTLNLPLQRRS